MAFPRIRVRDLSTFLEGLRNAGRTAFSSRIIVSDDYPDPTCRIEIEEGGSDGAGSAPFNECYDTQAAVLQAMRTLIECTCPVWKSAEFFFRGSFNTLTSEYRTLIGDLLPLIRSSPSLSTIRLDGYFDGLNLPSMVRDNPVLETLILSNSLFCAFLKELAGADSSGRQRNAHLTTLKLFPDGKLSEFMEELCRVLERNTTLKQVEVDPGTGSWEVRSLIAPRYGSKECVQDIVESIVIGKKLRVDTSLESVVVGSWKLVRVDGHGEWQMKYCGPCLRRRSPLAGETQYHVENYASLGYVSCRYDVKVKMRR